MRGADKVIADVLIVGGGLAGCAAAIGLARAGSKVVLLEREIGPQHKVCGEFLSEEALRYLRDLGVDVAAMGAAPIHRVRLAGGAGISEASLPFAAMSLTRRRLDAELLRLAESIGVDIRRGFQVRSLDVSAGNWRAKAADGLQVTAAAVFLATGKHDFPGKSRPKGKQSNLMAFKMYWRLEERQRAELSDHVELMTYRGGYGGLQLVEEGAANLCCLVERTRFQELGGRWQELLSAMQADCALLTRRLAGAEPLLAKPLAISSIPYGFVREQSEGLWSLGDQAAVIPSFTGDGMSIALHSGMLAAAMFLDGDTPNAFQYRLKEELGRQVAWATAISRGLVWTPTRGLLLGAVRLWPTVLGSIARRTRISESALRSVQMNDQALAKTLTASR